MAIHLTEYDCLYPDMLGDHGLDAIRECTVPGQDASIAVEVWREKLGFTVDPEGAWDEEELAAMSAETLAEKVLWLALGAFAESDGRPVFFCLE